MSIFSRQPRLQHQQERSRSLYNLEHMLPKSKERQIDLQPKKAAFFLGTASASTLVAVSSRDSVRFKHLLTGKL
jgi:hypothetical protein